MEENLYDEFGNYIGPELDSDSSSGSDPTENQFSGDEERDHDEAGDEEGKTEDKMTDIVNGHENEGGVRTVAQVADVSMDIVLHEDKKYYLESDEVYPDAEVVMQDEDAQSLDDPIIAPVEEKTFLTRKGGDEMSQIPETVYSKEFLLGLAKRAPLIRNIAVIGHLHHGKTSFCDILVEQTLKKKWDPEKEVRYLDRRQDEQDRKISIKSSPISLSLPDFNGKHYMLNVIDTPGHPNFSGEVSAALRISDGIVLVVDAVEGVQLNTRLLLKHSLQETYLAGASEQPGSVPKPGICLVINKIDRLIHELKLPPNDAYLKLLYIVNQVNKEIESYFLEAEQKVPLKVSPKLNNVCFASALHGWCFSLKSFGHMYCKWFGMKKIDPDAFAKKLWGEMYFDADSRKFLARKRGVKVPEDLPRTFVHFVLEPIYKIYSQAMGEDVDQLKKTCKLLHVKLTKSQLVLDVKPLLKVICTKFFGKNAAFVDMVLSNVKSPKENSAHKLRQIYSGTYHDLANMRPDSSEEKQSESKTPSDCDPNGPLLIQTVKLVSYSLATKKFFVESESASNSADQKSGNEFLALGRIFSGVIRQHDKVKLLGEKFRPGVDDEDQAVCEVTELFLPLGRQHLSVSHLPAGNWVLLRGVDHVITKTATLVSQAFHDRHPNMSILKPLRLNTTPVVKLAVEPLNPSELPQLLEAVRCVTKNYVLCETRVEESGEHVIFGTGELFLDCVMRDMREMYASIEIKVADPCVSFRETVVETSSQQCYAKTANKKNRLGMIAEPLDAGFSEDIEQEKILPSWLKEPAYSSNRKYFAKYLEDSYDWDVLAARSIWAFGPEDSTAGTNVLINDTLPSEIPNYHLLDSVKHPICQGFQWATREGPLCDEPVRSVKFKLLDVSLADKLLERSYGQIIPTTRRAVYSSFLTAMPKLMEPMYFVEVMCTAEVIPNVENVLKTRRGNVIRDEAVPGSPFFLIKGTLPVIDSFGFETDLRVHTRGLAFGLQVFDHWNLVPGDPMDSSVVLRPLEPARPVELAREFMIKTRRRKGLGEEVSVKKYFDADVLDGEDV